MRPSPSALSALVPLFALQAAACSASIATPGSSADSLVQDAAEVTSSAAVVVLERTVTADETAHASAVARFVKMRSGAVDDDALRMVGATLDLPSMGTCAAVEVGAVGGVEQGSPPDSLPPRAVELLDVGALGIDANGAHTMLEARALPDIVDLVTGVLYSARASTPDTDALPSRGEYLFHSSGSSFTASADRSVPAFTVSATAPGEPTELRIDGQDARAEGGIILDAKAPVELAWSVREEDESDPSDVVYVELVSADAEPANPRAATVRCVFADRGQAWIPASAFMHAGGADGMSRGTLVVHRVHRETFQVRGQVMSQVAGQVTGQVTGQAGTRSTSQLGIDSGVVRFDFARAADFTRR